MDKPVIKVPVFDTARCTGCRLCGQRCAVFRRDARDMEERASGITL